mmetsp:Transcript_7817/g.25054  ORF Transcript_7817/g.25054 Transcript_7817/m.25054 type:complete len:350 (-) Transcript_7817:752-1801(-)
MGSQQHRQRGAARLDLLCALTHNKVVPRVGKGVLDNTAHLGKGYSHKLGHELLNALRRCSTKHFKSLRQNTLRLPANGRQGRHAPAPRQQRVCREQTKTLLLHRVAYVQQLVNVTRVLCCCTHDTLHHILNVLERMSGVLYQLTRSNGLREPRNDDRRSFSRQIVRVGRWHAKRLKVRCDRCITFFKQSKGARYPRLLDVRCKSLFHQLHKSIRAEPHSAGRLTCQRVQGAPVLGKVCVLIPSKYLQARIILQLCAGRNFGKTIHHTDQPVPPPPTRNQIADGCERIILVRMSDARVQERHHTNRLVPYAFFVRQCKGSRLGQPLRCLERHQKDGTSLSLADVCLNYRE